MCGRAAPARAALLLISGMPPTVVTTPLRQLAPGLWNVEQVRRMAGAHQRLRMTVVALTGGGLWLYSPVEIDDKLAQQLAAVGNVVHVVAPNRYHHLFAGAAKRRYPAASLWAVPGLPESGPTSASTACWRARCLRCRGPAIWRRWS